MQVFQYIFLKLIFAFSIEQNKSEIFKYCDKIRIHARFFEIRIRITITYYKVSVKLVFRLILYFQLYISLFYSLDYIDEVADESKEGIIYDSLAFLTKKLVIEGVFLQTYEFKCPKSNNGVPVSFGLNQFQVLCKKLSLNIKKFTH